LSGEGIELPAVPRADYVRAFDFALSERASAMRTDVVDASERTVYPRDANCQLTASK
jgi:hypothetical protein